MNAPVQNDLFRAALNRQPVLGAYGAGVDSTAMLIEMVENGEPVDQVLMADTRSEKQETVEIRSHVRGMAAGTRRAL